MNEPNEIFNKFSENSRKILISAQKIAQSVNSSINSQHILLALAITPGTLAHSILEEHMISLDQIRLVISLQGTKNKKDSPGLTLEGKRVLEKAVFLAKKYHHSQIDPEHILLAIVSTEESLGYEIISRVGSNPTTIHDQVADLFRDIEDVDLQNFRGSNMQLQMPPSLNLEERTNLHEISPIGEQIPSREQKNILDYYTTDLTKLAADGKTDPLIGRERELMRVIQILSRRTKNNPVLVGESGVGKTAIVEGLALRITQGRVPTTILQKRIIMLDLALLVAGTMYRGQFEDRIKKIMDEIDKLGNVILFVDELHTVVGAGSAEGSLDAANILKPSLAKGKIRLIGATTAEEYRKVIEKDSALERRLQKIQVEEPTAKETVEILRGLRPKYEEFHHVKITDEAIEAAVNLSRQYINDRFLPDKAIDLIDEAAASRHLNRVDPEILKIKNLEKQIGLIKLEKEKCLGLQDYQKASELRDLELRISQEIESARKTHPPKIEEIEAPDIARVLSLWVNVPVENLAKSEQQRLLHLDKLLKKYIIGQDEAIKKVTQAIRRRRIGISDPNRPIGSFIFMGPTGVGKTELARVLAQEKFGSREAIIKIDMSEFMERHNVSRLVGAPPGYVGFDEAGKLTEQVRRKPYSIVLFDEIEKAHPEVFNILLQILEDGELTDAKGKKVNFRNTIIIMTSNLGVQQLNQQAAIGFSATGSQKRKLEENYQKMKNEILQSLKDEFRPELLNRIDNIVIFRPLNKKDLLKIIDMNLAKLSERLAGLGFKVHFESKVRDLILKEGFDPNFGARPIRRAISELIEDPLSQEILSGKVKKNEKVAVRVKKNAKKEIVFYYKHSRAPLVKSSV